MAKVEDAWMGLDRDVKRYGQNAFYRQAEVSVSKQMNGREAKKIRGRYESSIINHLVMNPISNYASIVNSVSDEISGELDSDLVYELLIEHTVSIGDRIFLK